MTTGAAAGEPATRVVLCADRTVGAGVAEVVRGSGGDIVALGLNAPPYASEPGAVLAAAGVDPALVFYGRSIATEVAVRKLAALRPELGISCGFASVLPRPVLDMPRFGWVNLHRSYLPLNRGVNPIQWAIVDGTPAGVSIHVMTEKVDAGPVIAQTELPVHFTDTGQMLEDRADEAMLELFRSTWPRLRRGDLDGTPQDEELATSHSFADCQALFRLDLNATMTVRRLLDILRAYSGERGSAVDIRMGAMRYTVHARIHKMVQHPSSSPIQPG